MLKTIADYLASRQSKGLAEASAANYRHRLGHLAKYLQGQGLTHWRDVKPKHLDAYVDACRKQGHAFGTRESYLIAAKCFFRWLADHGKIISDPSRHLEMTESRDDRPLLEPPLGEQDVAELLASLPRRNVNDLRKAAHLELLYSAGLRLGESLSLNVSDADLLNRVVHVRKGKGGKARDIPMMKGLCGALKDYLCLRRSLLRGPDHGALLLGATGKRCTREAFHQYIAKLNKQRGIGKQYVHAHLFRHSIAVHLLRGGTDIRYVQAFLGHESLDTTKEYLRLVPADIRDAYLKAMPEIAVMTA